MGADVGLTRITIFLAVPEEMVAVAATLAKLSGNPGEYPIEATATGGEAAAWVAQKGYSGRYRMTSQSLIPSDIQDMLVDGYAKRPEISYAAFWETTGQPVENGSNMTVQPSGPSFDAFAAALGVVRPQPSGVPIK